MCSERKGCGRSSTLWFVQAFLGSLFEALGLQQTQPRKSCINQKVELWPLVLVQALGAKGPKRGQASSIYVTF